MHGHPIRDGGFSGSGIFTLFLSLAIALRLLLTVFTPFGQTVGQRLEGLNDEPAHFNYVKYLAGHRSLPRQTGTVKDPGAFGRNDFEYYQPPLYYVIGAFFYAAFGSKAAFYCCRLFSCCCGILTVFCIGAIAYKTVPDPLLRRYAVLFAALFPTHAYFCAMISNDALSWLLATLIVYEMMSAGRPHSRGFLPWRRAIRLMLCLAAGMLTKSSLAVFFIVTATWFFAGSLAERNLRTALQGCAAIGGAAVIAAPWYIRNLAVYHSPFALNMGFGPPVHFPATAQAIAGFIKKTVHYFWFPLQNVRPESVGVKICNGIGGVILVIQGIAAAVYMFRNGRRSYRAALLALVLLVTIISYVGLNLSHAEPEGIFRLPAFSAIVFFFGAPVVGAFGRRGGGGRVLAAAIITAMYPCLYLLFTKAA